MEMFSGLLERFLRYISFDTMSDASLAGIRRPTTEGQESLLRLLSSELEAMGAETYYGEEKVVMGRLRGNAPGRTVGFMAHVDTADDVPGNGVKARVWKDYDGGDIELNGVTVRAEENPDLAFYRGSSVITSDGTTLLGADDKAGAAIIMEVLSYLVSHPEIKHPDVEVWFTPDEETGSGMDSFPYERMKAAVCYTLDGGREGEVETGCFNAARAGITVHGRACHLGDARGKLRNAAAAAAAIVMSLPQSESPEAADGDFGYFCPDEIRGGIAETSLAVYIRDFTDEGFRKRKETLEAIVRAVELSFHVEIDMDIRDQYFNMEKCSALNPFALDAVRRASEKLGYELSFTRVRGGTDGARLAKKGIPSPNLYTGGHNFHSLTEWISLEAMERSAALMLAVAEEWAE